MGRTTALRQAIKRTFVPFLAERGFSPDMRHAPWFLTFRQISAHAVHVCDIQWEKYGRPRFVVNFGKCSAKGVIFLDEHLLPGDIFPANTPVHGRLQPGKSPNTGSWFRQDRPVFRSLFSTMKLYPPDEVVAQLVSLFAEVEEFWRTGTIGPHIRLSPLPKSIRAKNVD
jgi:hypothetical protein